MAQPKRYEKGMVHSETGDTIQVLPPVQSTMINLTAGAASTDSALPAGSQVVRIAAVEDCYILFGNTGLTATTSHMLFLAGTEVIAVPLDASGELLDYVAVIQSTTGGKVNITKLGGL